MGVGPSCLPLTCPENHLSLFPSASPPSARQSRCSFPTPCDGTHQPPRHFPSLTEDFCISFTDLFSSHMSVVLLKDLEIGQKELVPLSVWLVFPTATSAQSCHRCPGPLRPQPHVQLTSSYGSCRQRFHSQSVSLPHQVVFHWFHWGLQVLLPSSNASPLPLTESSTIWTSKTHIMATGELLSKPGDSYACC